MFIFPKTFENKEEIKKFLLDLDKRIPNVTNTFMKSKNRIKAEFNYVKLAFLQLKNIPDFIFENDNLRLLFVKVMVAVTYTKCVLEEELKRRYDD